MTAEIINRTRSRFKTGEAIRGVKRVLEVFKRSGLRRSKTDYRISIVLVGRDEGRALNKRFLGKNRPANVLSFDYGPFGEIILTLPVLKEEARARQVNFYDWFLRMVVHGALHLAGRHHENSQLFAKRFAKLEKKLLVRLGLSFTA